MAKILEKSSTLKSIEIPAKIDGRMRQIEYSATTLIDMLAGCRYHRWQWSKLFRLRQVLVAPREPGGMKMYKIKVQSCDNPEESYGFIGETMLETVLACINGLTENSPHTLCDETLGDLLETIGKAVKDGSAKSWDFSSPESAYTIEVAYEDEDVSTGNDDMMCLRADYDR